MNKWSRFLQVSKVFEQSNGARGGSRTLTSIGYQILNLARLPIPPPGLNDYQNKIGL